jgi:hypothetical protein
LRTQIEPSVVGKLHNDQFPFFHWLFPLPSSVHGQRSHTIDDT